MRFIFFILSFLLISEIYAAPSDSIKVFVRSDKDQPIPNQKLSIDKNPPRISNKKGVFSFIPSKKLEIPCDVDLYSEEYAVDDYEYQETEKVFYVTLRKLVVPEFKLSVQFVGDKPAKKLLIQFKDKKYTTNDLGKVSILGKSPQEKDFIVAGEIVSFSKKGKDFIMVVKQPEPVVSKVEIEPTSNGLPDTLIAPAPEEVKTTFQTYTEEFSKIETELAYERKQIDEVDLKLRRQLDAITKRLNNEKGLSQAERNELLKYEAKLHQDLEENIVKFNESKKKIFLMMDKFRYSLMQKDSVNKIMESKLKAETERRMAIEMQSKRQALIYIIIILTILILAVVFYGIARKIRLQKTLLTKNMEIMNQSNLEKESKLLGIRSMFVDLFVWAKQLNSLQPIPHVNEIVENENHSLKSVLPETLVVENIGEIKKTINIDKMLLAQVWDSLKTCLAVDSWESIKAKGQESEQDICLTINAHSSMPFHQLVTNVEWQKAKVLSELLKIDLVYAENELIVKFNLN